MDHYPAAAGVPGWINCEPGNGSVLSRRQRGSIHIADHASYSGADSVGFDRWKLLRAALIAKVLLGGFAILVNVACSWPVFRRARAAEADDLLAMQRHSL